MKSRYYELNIVSLGTNLNVTYSPDNELLLLRTDFYLPCEFVISRVNTIPNVYIAKEYIAKVYVPKVYVPKVYPKSVFPKSVCPKNVYPKSVYPKCVYRKRAYMTKVYIPNMSSMIV